MEPSDTKKIKILFLFVVVLLGFMIFLGTLFYWATIERRLPRLEHSEVNHALRGNIVSADGFKIATSQQLYKAIVDTRNIDPKKLDLFVRLYSLYSGDDPKAVAATLGSNSGSTVLSYRIDSKTAKYLQELSRKLYKLGVFRSYEDPKTGVAFLHGLSVVESGEDRLYPAVDSLTPIVGYVRKVEQKNITKTTGVKGIERYYEDKLSSVQDSLVYGFRDIANTVILDGNSVSSRRFDGYDVHLTISLKMQKIIESVLDQYQKNLEAKEIIVGILNSDTAEFVALASSNRFNPDLIEKKDYGSLNVSAIEYIYEPGSVLKSITFALLLKANKVNPYDIVNVYGGSYKLGTKVIKDTHKADKLTAEDIIVYSSNVGTAQIAQKLDAMEFYQGLKDFGFSVRSGVDLPFENPGIIPTINRFNSPIYKATVGYGYGMNATFMQVIRAYNVFNNNGRILTPMLVKKLVSPIGQELFPEKSPENQIIPVSVAKRMQKILIKVVQQGTGTGAKIEGLEIGGKTGTAHIAEDGEYVRSYNGSFFGFANDKKNRYTIGVLVREAKKRQAYFAAQSAVPVFKEVVEKLVENGYLTPSSDLVPSN
ncbi:MAG: penicillin-binding protein 2 [Epsilonproteobacteria bacterium]|uniref:peptidoglycan D,D-transpeptidase FtsI family protein n=1 Tax=Sulfurospirillum TaxID=57665 RepID=UPI0005AA59DB|nr:MULTISPECIES: penicillin-binding protein 2 [Sulfurospirillum]MCP3650684.1 penicillin-binding protein 2 [Sulfurospirillum sp. DNRA8]MCR1809529.1 penicillin-binding protein 2 [Sulfurospirillum sp. DNRA8]NCB55074.1 penicillin-binding protein 2 [Campylobacterota bacterium]